MNAIRNIKTFLMLAIAMVALSSSAENLENTPTVIKGSDTNRIVKITSNSTDYDRKVGVLLFDGNVCVDDPEYKMHADQIYVFLDGTNELKRIVAIGDVAVTNELRSGECAKATYTKSSGKLVMYSSDEKMAKLIDSGKNKSEVQGRKITFWTNSEHVEVEGSTVTIDGGAVDKGNAKSLLGK